jgi:hypothetical protein
MFRRGIAMELRDGGRIWPRYQGDRPHAAKLAALIAFLNHNRGRIQRDAQTLDTPVGLATAIDASSAQNPGVGLAALCGSITQFAATVTSPAVAAASPAIAGLTHANQTMSAAAGDVAKEHPQAAAAGSAGVVAGAGATGLWLFAELWSGVGKVLGFGAGAGGAAAGGAATAAGGSAAGAGGGLMRIIGGAAGAASLPGVIDLVTGDNRTDAAKAIDATILEKIKSWFAPTSGPATLRPGRYVHSPATGPYAYFPAGGAARAASRAGVIALVTGDNRTDAAKAIDAAILERIKSWFAPTSSPGAPMQLPGASHASPVGTPLGLYKPATLGPGAPLDGALRLLSRPSRSPARRYREWAGAGPANHSS